MIKEQKDEIKDSNILSWNSFPFIERPITSIILVAFIIAITIYLWFISVEKWEMPLFYFVFVLLFTLELLPYFIPTTYKIYEDYIEIRYAFVKVEKKFNMFGCYYADKRGVLLSTFTKPSRLDRFRGQSLRFSKSKNEKDELFSILDKKIGRKY